MYILISPAKKLASSNTLSEMSKPAFPKDTELLVSIMQQKSPEALQGLMGISENLALLNVERYQDFGTVDSQAKGGAAVLTFAGDTYQGLDAHTFEPETLEYAHTHLGILSGLYGLLSARDAIEPYRLEMGTKLTTERGKNLYEFWGDRITDELNARIEATDAKFVVNLASKEYFSVVKPKQLAVPVITPVFKDVRKGVAKVISFLAKRARGSMARYILANQLNDRESLTLFNENGYTYNPAASAPLAPVFIREDPNPS